MDRRTPWNAEFDLITLSGMNAVSVHLRRPSETSHAEAWAVLDDDERGCAHRFHRRSDAHRFVTTRFALREALTERCPEVPAATWRYRRTSAGRPFLGRPETTLEFSVSRTDDLVAVAVSGGAPCGIDVETVERLPDVEELAANVLTDDEHAGFRALTDPDEQAEAFFRSWTLKEAYGKAIGKGLGYELDRVEVRHDGDGVALAGELEGPPGCWSAFVRCVGVRERLALVIRNESREPIAWELHWATEGNR